MTTAECAPTDNRGNLAVTIGPERFYVEQWLRGVTDATNTGRGSGGGNVAHSNDAAAQEADILQVISTFHPNLQAACHLSRLLDWRCDIETIRQPVLGPDGEQMVDAYGDPLTRDVAKVNWFVWGGWLGVCDPILVATHPVSRREIRRHQLVVRRCYRGADDYYRAITNAAGAVARRLGPGWLVMSE